MGIMTLYAACVNCHQLFTCSPSKVPSLIVDGTREPICLNCVNKANPIRVANGLEPIVPLPGAYEGDDEAALD